MANKRKKDCESANDKIKKTRFNSLEALDGSRTYSEGEGWGNSGLIERKVGGEEEDLELVRKQAKERRLAGTWRKKREGINKSKTAKVSLDQESLWGSRRGGILRDREDSIGEDVKHRSRPIPWTHKGTPKIRTWYTNLESKRSACLGDEKESQRKHGSEEERREREELGIRRRE